MYVGGIDLGSRDGACEKSREIGVMRLKRLVYSSPRGYSCRTPSVRYVSDGASFCTYTAVEKELVPWHMLHHGREHVPTLRHPGIVSHFETKPSINFERVSSHSKLLHAILNCKPVHTDHNLNGFPLRSVLVPR